MLQKSKTCDMVLTGRRLHTTMQALVLAAFLMIAPMYPGTKGNCGKCKTVQIEYRMTFTFPGGDVVQYNWFNWPNGSYPE